MWGPIAPYRALHKALIPILGPIFLCSALFHSPWALCWSCPVLFRQRLPSQKTRTASLPRSRTCRASTSRWQGPPARLCAHIGPYRAHIGPYRAPSSSSSSSLRRGPMGPIGPGPGPIGPYIGPYFGPYIGPYTGPYFGPYFSLWAASLPLPLPLPLPPASASAFLQADNQTRENRAVHKGKIGSPTEKLRTCSFVCPQRENCAARKGK